jgi:hypothetical protein
MVKNKRGDYIGNIKLARIFEKEKKTNIKSKDSMLGKQADTYA